MDPNEAHNRIELALAAMSDAMNTTEYLDAADALWTAVTDLNNWLKDGGFLPVMWKSEWSE